MRSPLRFEKEERAMSTATMTIQEFNALLKMEETKEENALWQLLRQIAAIKKPEEVRHLIVRPTGIGWA